MGATVTSKKFEQRPGRDILAAVSNLGGKIDTFEEITRLRTPESRHGCFRLVLMDGRIVKGRRFKSAEKRESVTALYPSLEGLPFSRILSMHGAATIEEWIHGSPVDPEELSAERTHDLATILGTLHSRSVPREIVTNENPDVDEYSDRLASQLRLLVDQGHSDSQRAERLFTRATARVPTELENGIMHTDFHPRNMILNRDGEVWTVDNEDLRLGALDYDVARCWRQWPMTRAQRDAFCSAYGHIRSLESFLTHQEFWSICTLVNSTFIHLRYQQPIQEFLEQLDGMLEPTGDALWPVRS